MLGYSKASLLDFTGPGPAAPGIFRAPTTRPNPAPNTGTLNQYALGSTSVQGVTGATLITGISPANDAASSAVAVTITGTGFGPAGSTPMKKTLLSSLSPSISSTAHSFATFWPSKMPPSNTTKRDATGTKCALITKTS